MDMLSNDTMVSNVTDALGSDTSTAMTAQMDMASTEMDMGSGMGMQVQ